MFRFFVIEVFADKMKNVERGFFYFVRESKEESLMKGRNYFVFKVDTKNLKKRQLKSLNFIVSCNGFSFEIGAKLKKIPIKN